MELNFDFTLLGFDGNPLKEGEIQLNAGKVLAAALGGAKSEKIKDPMKSLTWGMKLYNGESLVLDESDTAKLKEFISSEAQLTDIATGQMLKVFIKQDSEKAK